MIRKILFITLLSFNLFALEVSLSSAKEDFQKYSTFHIKDKNNFLCEEMKNDFDEVTQIVCAFSKRPSDDFKKLQNDFFKIDTQIKDRTFFLIITPYKMIKLFPMIFDLTKDRALFTADVKLSNHWMIVGYEKKLPYINKESDSDVSINFSFESNANKLPFVGSLDIKGNPVHIKKVKDVTGYLKIKEFYDDKQYEKCLDLIEEISLEYPDSLFTSELLYYKMKVYKKTKDYDSVIELAKLFLREYSSDENIPEVLAYTAKAYAMSGIGSDANYFFDRLFSEHPDSEFAKWGFIYKAEMLESSGGSSKAIDYYKRALHETQDIEIAATAAYHLAKIKLDSNNFEESSFYIDKIVKAMPEYFLNDLATSTDMMYAFADEKDFKTASDIAKSLMDVTDKGDEHEQLLRDRGIWLSKTSFKQEALKSLNHYLEVYKDGMFEREVEITKDGLFFDTTDDNLSVKIAKYDELMKNYQNDTIGDRAMFERAILLLQNGMYHDVFSSQDRLRELDYELYGDTNMIITESAMGVMRDSLKKNECENALKISHEYNITLSDEWDDGIYECSMRIGDFKISKNIASKNIKLKDLDQRKKWLYRYIKVDFATGSYSDVVDASKDLIALIEDDKDSKYRDVHRYLFDSYQRLEDKESMINKIVDIQKIYTLDYKDIERYIAIMAIGSDRKDDTMVIKYGREVMKIQNSSNSYAQSPFVEFTLYQSYLNKENFNDALEIIRSLDSVDLTATQRARQKYLLGTSYERLWRDDEAQEAYREAIDADANSAWGKLAKSAMEI